MNKIYRIVWNEARGAFVVAHEKSKAKGKPSSARKAIASAVVMALTSTIAYAAPTGGQVVSGSGGISQSGSVTTVSQSTQNLSLNWQTFNIAPTETVNFVQPSASAIAVNRISDPNGSQIMGHLNANGQVFLLNPNGVLFGQGAQINVGGLVASTLNFSDAQLGSGTMHFSGNGSGSVINQGSINAANGGYVVLMGNKVSNQGTITAQLGTVALAGGSATTLTFNGNQLLTLQVDQSTLNNLAENGGLIQADGGHVIMTAGAASSLLASVVNNTGVVRAQTVSNQNGVITLLGGMTAGTVNVGGTLDASAPKGGNGGAIETSAAHVEVANTANVTTAAASGLTGTWLLDPVDFTVAATGGDMTGAAVTTALASNNFTIQSSSGATGTSGNININDSITWSAHTLTLNAYNNININSEMFGSGTAGLALLYGQGATNGVINTVAATYNVNAPIDLATSGSFSTQLGSTGTPVNYTIVTSLGVPADATTAPSTMTLQGMAAPTSMAGHYVLGGNIDATATSQGAWYAAGGFTPIGTSGTNFSGTFDGLGHTISNLTINRTSLAGVGLFGYGSSTSVIRNVGLVGGTVIGSSYVGGLVGNNSGMVYNSYNTGNVSNACGCNYGNTGGLVGANIGSISNSYSTGVVTGSGYTGGLVGLVGQMYASSVTSGNVTNSYSTATVSSSAANGNFGGLVGFLYGGTISNSYATGAVSASTSNYVGGLVGQLAAGTHLSNSYSTGSVTGGSYVGGLVGSNGATVGNGGSVTNNFYNWSNNQSLNGFGGNGIADVPGTVWGMTTTDMQNSANFTGATGTSTLTDHAGNGNSAPGWTFTTTPGLTGNNWVIVDRNGTLNNVGTNAGATSPMLSSEYSTTINNVHQLQLMAMGLAASYTLGSNIAAAATGGNTDVWNGTFVPVGTSSANFIGTLDGQGYTINGLVLNGNATGVGLFGYASAASVISNVALVGGSTHGLSTIGGLAGQDLGTVTNSSNSGSVSGTFYVGGLVGNNGGTIGNSHTTGNVSDAASARGSLGGLVGNNTGTISNSYATGNVSGVIKVGGLAGSNSGTINNSYATGAVSGAVYGGLSVADIGGLVGYNTGTISNAYSTGNVSGTVSGILTLTELGGLVGLNTGILNNAFYNIDQVTISGTHKVTAGGIYNAQYVDWFGSNSVISSKTLNIANYSSSLPAGTGGYYNVSSQQGLNDLLGFSESNAANNFRLTGSLSLTAGFYIPYFAGSFDGGGNTLSSLSLTLPNSYLGMFGYLPSSSTTIANLGVLNASVSGHADVGGLVGYNNGGTISNSYVTGSVSSTGTYVGGLVGFNKGSTSAITDSYAAVNVNGAGTEGGLAGANYGSITRSYATGNVNGTTGATFGGLVGYNSGLVVNSYATGNVSASAANAVGGLAGQNASGTISNSYAAGSVSGSSAIGALVGTNTGSGTITNSFYDSTINPSLTGISLIANVVGTVWGMSTADMQNQANFNSATAANGNSNPNWDFGSTWVMYEGHTAPLLRVFLTPLTVTANSSSSAYTGSAQTGSGATYSITPNMNYLTGTLSYSGGGTNVGSYTITPSGLNSYVQLGYLITYVNGSLTITAPTPTTTTTDNSSSNTADRTQPVQTAPAQILSNVLVNQAGTPPQTLSASSTMSLVSDSVANNSSNSTIGSGMDSAQSKPGLANAVAVNVTMSLGGSGTLQIQNGGMRMPDNGDTSK